VAGVEELSTPALLSVVWLNPWSAALCADEETWPGALAAKALATCAVTCATIGGTPPTEACGTAGVEFG